MFGAEIEALKAKALAAAELESKLQVGSLSNLISNPHCPSSNHVSCHSTSLHPLHHWTYLFCNQSRVADLEQQLEAMRNSLTRSTADTSQIDMLTRESEENKKLLAVSSVHWFCNTASSDTYTRQNVHTRARTRTLHTITACAYSITPSDFTSRQQNSH